MLVLTRKLQQQIKIGEQITVTILKVKGNTVRVGINAPREVRVVRGELPKMSDADEASTAVIAASETVTAATEEQTAADETAEENIISFRVRCVDGTPAEAAETATQVSAAQMPLGRIQERFGGAPLKHLMASCAAVEP
jgi:carbon storage regulator